MKTLDGELNLMTRAMEQEQRQNASLNKQVGKLQETVRMLEEGRKGVARIPERPAPRC